MTIEVTTRWRHTGVRYDGEYPEGEEYVSPLRERRYTVTFLLNRGSHPDSRPSMKLVIEGENWWCAWLRGTGKDRYLRADQTPDVSESVCRSTWRSSTRIWDDDERKPIVNDYMIPLWPFVCPPAFNDLLNGRRVSRGEDAEIDGRMCRSVRIETRWETSTPSICTLWMPKGEDRVVKVEYAPPLAPDLVEKLTDEQIAELGTVCVVTSYEETESSAYDEFDPVPLLERWANETAEAVASDVEKINESWSGGFGDFGGPGFGEETDDESDWGGFGGGFDDDDDGGDTPDSTDDGDAEEGAAE